MHFKQIFKYNNYIEIITKVSTQQAQPFVKVRLP